MPDRSAVRVSAGTAAILVLLALPRCLGWGSAALPPRLTDAEERVVEGAHLPLTVGVVRFAYPAYSDSLVEVLEDTDLFDRVAPVEDFETPPDLLAHVDRRIHGTAVLPLWTLLTFGVIPSSYDEEHGSSFWLEAPGARSERWHVEYAHTGRTTLGWVALFDVFVPDRTVLPITSSRMHDQLSLRILEHRDALLAAARRSTR